MDAQGESSTIPNFWCLKLGDGAEWRTNVAAATYDDLSDPVEAGNMDIAIKNSGNKIRVEIHIDRDPVRWSGLVVHRDRLWERDD